MLLPRFLLGIPCVNRIDLLQRAVQSVRPLWDATVVVDNTADGLNPEKLPVTIQRPSVPLTFTQTMNFLFRLAHDHDCEVLLSLHNDAAAGPGTAEEMLRAVAALGRERRRWGVALSNYDAFVAFAMHMVAEVGNWDTNLPHYFADNDYYRRVRLAGYEVIETGLPVMHDHSSTIRSDPDRCFVNAITFPLHAAYYAAKWGGAPGAEVFVAPFGGRARASI